MYKSHVVAIGLLSVLYLADAMANACCLSQEVAQSVGSLGQDVIIWVGPGWIGVEHGEVSWVVQGIRVGHAIACLPSIRSIA